METNETVEKTAFLTQKHEELLAKRESLLELQKTKNLQTNVIFDSRKGKHAMIKERNQQLLDELGTCCRKFKEEAYALADGKLEILKENYLGIVNKEFSGWLQDIEYDKTSYKNVNTR